MRTRTERQESTCEYFARVTAAAVVEAEAQVRATEAEATERAFQAVEGICTNPLAMEPPVTMDDLREASRALKKMFIKPGASAADIKGLKRILSAIRQGQQILKAHSAA